MVRVSTIRFFLAVMPAPAWILAGFVAVVLLGAWTIALNPRNVDSALACVLLLQVLSASSGYGPAAARGWLDPLLVSGRSRWSIALGSAIAAALPGLAAWGAILVAAIYAGPDAIARAFAANRFAALLIVSGGAWAFGLRLPRLAGGALWMMAMIGLALTHAALPRFVEILDRPEGVSQLLLTAAACGVWPLLLLGDDPGPRDPLVVVLSLAAAAVPIGLAVRHVVNRDYTLEEPS